MTAIHGLLYLKKNTKCPQTITKLTKVTCKTMKPVYLCFGGKNLHHLYTYKSYGKLSNLSSSLS